eukprot:355949-Chlamydomonas_euryale.AAC.4
MEFGTSKGEGNACRKRRGGTRKTRTREVKEGGGDEETGSEIPPSSPEVVKGRSAPEGKGSQGMGRGHKGSMGDQERGTGGGGEAEAGTRGERGRGEKEQRKARPEARAPLHCVEFYIILQIK